MNFILNLAPTGMIPTKALTPFVPVTIDEIVSDVLSCYHKGITSVHLHARDENGQPTHSKDIYAKIIGGIREHAPDLVIGVSSSGRNVHEFEKRSEVLDLQGDVKPDMASLTLGSLNFLRSASVNEPDMIMRLAEKMLANGIKPELEIFDIGMLNYAHYLIKQKLLEPPYYFNILLGNIASAQMELTQAGMLISTLPEYSYWSMAGIGDTQLTANMTAIANNGGARTGIEDNRWFDAAHTQLASNLDLVSRIHSMGAICGRSIMSPMEFRNIFNINR